MKLKISSEQKKCIFAKHLKCKDIRRKRIAFLFHVKILSALWSGRKDRVKTDTALEHEVKKKTHTPFIWK